MDRAELIEHLIASDDRDFIEGVRRVNEGTYPSDENPYPNENTERFDKLLTKIRSMNNE